jgi:hypothetical protein
MCASLNPMILVNNSHGQSRLRLWLDHAKQLVVVADTPQPRLCTSLGVFYNIVTSLTPQFTITKR